MGATSTSKKKHSMISCSNITIDNTIPNKKLQAENRSVQSSSSRKNRKSVSNSNTNTNNFINVSNYQNPDFRIKKRKTRKTSPLNLSNDLINLDFQIQTKTQLNGDRIMGRTNQNGNFEGEVTIYYSINTKRVKR